MSHSPTPSLDPSQDQAAPADAYRDVLDILNRADQPFLVGGAYAFAAYTGIARDTKDLDLFILPADYARVAQLLQAAGHDTSLTYPHWLGKVRAGEADIDLIFNSGNGLTVVDSRWFEHSVGSEVLGMPVRLVPVEEMIWSKAFVMERERFDGADIAHLLRYHAKGLDWRRLLDRFGPHWRVLLGHLVLFGYIYPAKRERVPRWVMASLVERLQDETLGPPPDDQLCQGTLLSREQYLHDIRTGHDDARAGPHSTMSGDDIASWTEAIGKPYG